MKRPLLLYCYDAYCGWCYGFSSVMREIHAAFKDRIRFEVLSGGMILPEQAKPIGVMAGYIQSAYRTVEDRTGVQFGQDYLWHVFHPAESDWVPCSEKPAIALSIFKEYAPDQQVAFATDLQYALHAEGRDLCDNEAYRHLLIAYGIPPAAFYEQLKQETYMKRAYDEFSLCQQLRVTGFPSVFLQINPTRYQWLAHGYTDKETFQQRLEAALMEINSPRAAS